ncbi:MAG: hypothetical protein V5A22_00215 [Salinivenus sp.]
MLAAVELVFAEQGVGEGPAKVRLRPTALTLSTPGLVLLLLFPAVLGLLKAPWVVGATGGAVYEWGYGPLHLPLLAWCVAFGLVYGAAHQPMRTEAHLEGERLIIRDPAPWWRCLSSPLDNSRLSLEIKDVEAGEGYLLVTGAAEEKWEASRYKVRLNVDAETQTGQGFVQSPSGAASISSLEKKQRGG